MGAAFPGSRRKRRPRGFTLGTKRIPGKRRGPRLDGFWGVLPEATQRCLRGAVQARPRGLHSAAARAQGRRVERAGPAPLAPCAARGRTAGPGQPSGPRAAEDGGGHGAGPRGAASDPAPPPAPGAPRVPRQPLGRHSRHAPLATAQPPEVGHAHFRCVQTVAPRSGRGRRLQPRRGRWCALCARLPVGVFGARGGGASSWRRSRLAAPPFRFFSFLSFLFLPAGGGAVGGAGSRLDSGLRRAR